MKKLVLFVLLLPALALAQSGAFGHGGSSLDLSTLLPIIADSSWLKLDDADTVTTKAARDLKVPGLLVTGTSKFEGEVTVRNNVTLSSSGVTELNADSLTADTGIRSEGGGLFKGDLYSRGKVVGEDSMRTNGVVTGKGGASFGATATPVTISSAGKVTAADSIAAGKGIRSEGPALFKGDITARTKAVINDSVRVEKTSIFKGSAAFGTGTNWFVAEDSVLTVHGRIILGTSNFGVTKQDTIFTAGFVPRWIKFTSGTKTWYSPVYSDTTGKW